MLPSRLDRACFPRTTAYLERLPGGLAAYPDCTIRAHLFCELVAAHPDLSAGLPLPLAAALHTPRAGEDWMPLVHFMMAQLVLLEGHLGGDTAAYVAGVQEQASRLFAHPIYRAGSQLLSPNLLLMGAGRRFATFCRGITYESQGFAKTMHVARMGLPPHALCQLGLDFFAACFTAAVAATRAQDVRIVGSFVSPSEARFQGTWH